MAFQQNSINNIAAVTSRLLTQAAHGFSVGNQLALSGSTYILAKADTAANCEIVGMVITVIDTNRFVIICEPWISGLSGLTAGTVYFSDPVTAGAFTSTSPNTVGQINKPVLVADTTTSGYFVNYRGELLSAAVQANILVGRASTIVSTVATGATVIPIDDTIPQNTEGDQYMTLAYTPANVSNILEIEIGASLTCSSAAVVTGALYQDTTANALAADAVSISTGGQSQQLTLKYIMAAGTTSSTTFKFRAGTGSVGTVTFNGSTGTRRYGGVSASNITIKEYTL